MKIQHNIAAMNTNRQLGILADASAKNMERLSSGYRINRAADDAAGLAISEKMNSRIRALKRCQNNIEEGIGLAQTADGALQEVNNMLVRVHELCVQAANGTNTEDDRSMIADEIDQIYEEMDRIFEDTEYNTIPVFRYDGINFNAEKTGYSYKESVKKLPDGQYAQFGEMDGLPRKQFELAEKAKGASVTLTLDSDIDLNDATSLDGKTFFIDLKYQLNGYEYNETARFDFTSKWGGTGTENGIRTMYIGLYTSSETVQEAFDRLCRDSVYNSPFKYLNLESATISQVNGTNQVTLQLAPTSLEQNFLIDGSQTNYSVAEGCGTQGNEFVIYSQEGSKVEEIDSLNNTITYSQDIHMEWYFYTPSQDVITEKQKEALKESYFDINRDSNITRVSFSDAEIDALQTPDDLRILLMKTLESMSCEVSYNGSKVLITSKNCVSATKDRTVAYINEVKKDGTGKNSSIIAVNTYETISPTLEKAGEWVVELPENLNADIPFSINVNGRNATFYNAEDVWVKVKEGDKYAVSNGDVMRAVKNFIDQRIDNATVTVKDNKIVIQAEHANEDLNISVSSNSVEYHTYGIMVEEQEFQQEYYISLDMTEAMTGSFDVEALYGKGFEHNEAVYEFSDSTSALSDDSVIRMDISACTNYDDIAMVMEEALNKNNDYSYFYDYNVTNVAGIVTIQSERIMGNAGNVCFAPVFSDGYAGNDGLFNDRKGEVKKNFSGGTDTTQPYAEIDFSKYNVQNKEELYGKGFRVTCATCPGEFINVMFCEDKSECEIPESFEYEYTDSTGTITKTTIKNYIVELKDVSNGSQIVDSIVRQLESELDHFTEVEADGTTLIVRDKRAGDMYDKLTGQLQRAEVIPGIYTNYVYTIEREKDSGKPEKELIDEDPEKTKAYYSFVMIYASDTAENPYIPLHLPHLTLDNLLLEPVSEHFKTREGVEKVMKQAKNAASMISKARSKIGADQNRLEHAFEVASNAEIQITDAYSRIKDADMAEEMVINAKWNILQQAAQTILSQNAQQTERILNLLQ